MKPTPTQKKKLYALLHEYVRLRDGAWCLRCHATERLQLSHIHPKGKHRLMEFMHENVKLLCMPCHLFWWHRSPIEAAEWIKEVLPKDRYDRLRMATRTYLGPLDPKLVILELETLIKRRKICT